MQTFRNLLGLTIIGVAIIVLYIFPEATTIPKKIKSPAEMIVDSARHYLNLYESFMDSNLKQTIGWVEERGVPYAILQISQKNIANEVAMATMTTKATLDQYCYILDSLKSDREIDIIAEWYYVEFYERFSSCLKPQNALVFLIDQANQRLEKNQPRKNEFLRETWVQVSFLLAKTPKIH